jgi:dihydrofolate reductase
MGSQAEGSDTMRITLTENCTVDGVIDLSGGWFDPAQQDDELIDVLRGQMAEQDSLLLGRVTFESFREYWPNQTDDSTGIRDHLNRVHKYVVSSTLDEPGWDNTTVLRRSPVEEVRALRDATEGELGATGSISVAHQLIAADLIDEYRLLIYPIAIGTGARLFPDGSPRLDLRPLDSRSFPSGVTQIRFERQR